MGVMTARYTHRHAINQALIPPPPAVAAGYNALTFNSSFASSLVDQAGSNVSGKQWYLWNFFGDTPDGTGLTFSQAGGISFAGRTNNQLSTAAQTGGGAWVGTAFGGGGYFEARLRFDRSLVNTANGWPAFWSMAIEHMLNSGGDQWSGQASNYVHFGEADFFEWIDSGDSYYGTIHDWYGIYNTTCGPGFCHEQSANSLSGAAGINWNEFHKVAMLWIPATGGSNGSATFYLDDVQQGSPVTWSQYTNQSPTPTGQAWKFGILDSQHWAMNIGSGLNQPMSVDSVRVWQASAAGNLVF